MPRTVVMQQPLRQTVSATPQPSGSASAYLLIVPLSVFGGVAAAYGFSVLTELPFTISLIVAAVLYLTKMYFFRSQTPQEQMMNNGWDRVAGYLVTAFFFVALAAFGLYEFNHAEIAASEPRLPIEGQSKEAFGQPRDASPNGFETTAEETSDSKSRRKADRAIEFRKLLAPEPLVSSQNLRPVQTEAVSSSRSTGASINASTGGREGFIKATLAQNADAIGCWIALLVMEAFVVMLVHHNRPRYIYPYV